jgi:hypothetical protein
MVVKFNSSALPDQATIDQFQIRQVTIAPDVLGWFATDLTGDILLSEGDYFLSYSSTDFRVVRRTEYLANTQLKRLVIEEIAVELIENIIQGFVDLAATDAVKLDLLKTIDVVLIMITGNKINASQVIATAIPTTANFTTPRKNGLIALIDAAILKL